MNSILNFWFLITPSTLFPNKTFYDENSRVVLRYILIELRQTLKKHLSIFALKHFFFLNTILYNNVWL